MYHHHLVRVGALGHVGRFSSVDSVRYPRGKQVILRTARGLETGEILSNDGTSAVRGSTDGAILRGMTVEDQLLQARLDKDKDGAFQACTQHIRSLGVDAVLMDVELLFDGRGLYFYFLGDVPPELEAVTDQLAAVYDARSQIRSFSEAVSAGCGPGCGTDEAEGGGCGSDCASCSISRACSSSARAESSAAKKIA